MYKIEYLNIPYILNLIITNKNFILMVCAIKKVVFVPSKLNELAEHVGICGNNHNLLSLQVLLTFLVN